ncbi:MAG TPA: ribonucleoside triphosphate reductase, partial [Sphaerochaeta sp.]|nr:ribonucleoside triphosphate reductase [Sphaerochaeta sp.]
MYQVIKRTGKTVDFDIKKIENAIVRAFVATNKNYNEDVIQMLALRASARFADKVKDDKVSIEDIQDGVEATLAQAGYDDVAKAYILYRKQHENIRQADKTLVDYKKLIDSYLGAKDWRVKENSTVNYSIGGLILSNSGAVTANYWLSEIYDNEIGEAHRSAAIHLHDLSMLSGYCAGWSLKQLIREGLGGVNGKISSAPAKHLSTLCNQMVNFIGIMQNEWAGA